MKIIYEPRHQNHRPKTEILYGKPTPHPEQPERVEAIWRALAGTRWESEIVAPRAYPLEMAHLVHEPAYVQHILDRSAQTDIEGHEGEWFPYVWPRDRGLDTGTPISAGTPEIAWTAACSALTGADLLLEGQASVYALCRPPGHHAAAGAFGGYCYFNNAALGAANLMDRSGSPQGVAILDLDIHHGNGTQDIFYGSDRVLYCSLHGEPEWAYPPHTGFPEEAGSGAGTGFTFNQPLPKETAWDSYAAALERALERIARFGPSHLVLSQGFDTFAGDRWGGFLLQAEDYARIGHLALSVGVPVLAVLEGGYEPANIAAGSLALIEGLAG